LFFIAPVTPKYQIEKCRSSGMEDVFVQGEYALAYRERERSTGMLTLVSALYFPTGSAKKNPHTGAGSPSFFIGGTASYTSVEWYGVVSPCILLTTPSMGTKFGSIFYYQGCLGRNIVGNPQGWIVTALVELLGWYQFPDRFNGKKDPNSGFNITYLGPTIWASSQKFFGQVGILFPAHQSYRGCQPKNTFLFAADIGWKFNT
jgi:hypothetical protein